MKNQGMEMVHRLRQKERGKNEVKEHGYRFHPDLLRKPLALGSSFWKLCLCCQ